MKKLLFTSATAFIISIVFLILQLSSALDTHIYFTLGFVAFLGISVLLLGITLIVYSRRLLQWQLETSDYHEWIWKIQGWTDEQIKSTDSIFFVQSPKGFRFATRTGKITGVILTIVGTGWVFSSIVVWILWVSNRLVM